VKAELLSRIIYMLFLSIRNDTTPMLWRDTEED